MLFPSFLKIETTKLLNRGEFGMINNSFLY